jgi:arylsulfatase A-like enzyme
MKSNQAASAGTSRRDFIRIAGGAMLALPALGCQSAGHPRATARLKPEKPKNILFVMTDQQHIRGLSAAGCRYVETPAMDQIAKTGTSFTNSYCPYPVCVPSRAATFSGRASSEALLDRGIDPSMPNLGQWFSEQSDYETIYCGKWHLPATYTPYIDGFRVLTSGLAGMGYICDSVISRACEAYIRNTPRSRSFMMVASFMQPHDICEWLRLNTEDPRQLRYPELADQLPPLPANFHFDAAEPRWVRQYRAQGEPFLGDRNGDPQGRWAELQWRYYLWSYYRHLEQVDAEIGRILEALEDTGRLQETLIVFTSDHGEGMGCHQTVRKGTTYDETAMVPLIFSWPGHVPAGREEPALASGLDIMPTLCEYAGIRQPPQMRGLGLRASLERGAQPDRPCVVMENAGNAGRAVRSRDFKYIAYADDPVEQLFDIRHDLGETRNLAVDSSHASVLAEHRTMLKEWESRLRPQPDRDRQEAWWRVA